MKNKDMYNNLLLVLNVVLFLVLAIGHSFAFFEATIEGNDTSSKDVFYVEDLRLRTKDLAPVVFYKQPGESLTNTFTVTNTGVKTVKSYTINLSEVYNSFINKEDVVYTLTCESSTDTCESVEQTVFPSESKEILIVNDIDVEEVHTFNLTVTYLENDHDTSNINNLQYKITINKVDDISIVNLKDNIIDVNDGISSIIAKDNSSLDNGMYATSDISGTSYYYKGSINNNYVSFADFMWRIVRINGDGSIRMILNDYAQDENGNAYSTVYNSSNTCKSSNIENIDLSNSCVSYSSSSIINTVNTWYENNINGIYKNYIKEDSIFCHDYSYIDGSYASDNRLISNKTPNLTCTPISENGLAQKLTLPVGLLSADELFMAGAYYNINNTSLYLYIGTTNWWTMSPAYWDNKNFNTTVITSGSTSLSRNELDNEAGIRPVINLKSTVRVSGTGIIDDPYRIIYE